MKSYYTYVIQCFDGTFYVGVTNDVERRFFEHRYGADPRAYTYNRGPLLLVYVAETHDIRDAIAFEKKFKGWSHARKRAFIEGDYAAMKRYGKGRDRNRPAKST